MTDLDTATLTRALRTAPDVAMRRTCAYWYAAGLADATGEIDRSQEFADFAEAQARAYHVDQTRTFLACIPDQWAEFCKVQRE
jgi:hypothetical protein